MAVPSATVGVSAGAVRPWKAASIGEQLKGWATSSRGRRLIAPR